MKQPRTIRPVIRRRILILGVATAGLSPFAWRQATTHAASANWSATPTNGMWEATGAESNWSSGVATFPGSTAGITTSTDVATFTGTSTVTSISLNATTPNSLPLNIGSLTFTGANKSSWTIGSTSGNPLWLTATNANDGATTLQISISGAGSSGTGGTETINSPIVLQPLPAAAGFYAFQNNSTGTAAALDKLIFNGAITGGATTGTGTLLTLRGGNTNTTNAINGAISNGAGPALGIVKRDGGVWTLAGNNSFTGVISVVGGILRINGNNTPGSINFNGGGTTLTLVGGTVTSTTVNSLAAGASNGRILQLDGGTLQLSGGIGTAGGAFFVNFNGATLKSAGAITVEGTSQNTTTNHIITVQAGGATLDTSGGQISSSATFNGTASGVINVQGGNTFASAVTNNGVMNILSGSTWDLTNTAGVESSVGGLIGTGTVASSAASRILTSNVASGSQTFAGVLGGGAPANLSFVKAGAGTQIISGTSHTVTGPTSINAGSLIVSGALTTSVVTVNDGGTLRGTGDGITTGKLGDVILAAGTTTGGTLAPGVLATDGSVGTLTIANLNANNGSTRFDLVSPGASDQLNVTSATFSASNTFTLLGIPASGTYTLVQSSTALAGTQPTLVTPTGTRATYTPHYGDVDPNQFQLIVAGSPKSITWTGGISNAWDVTGTSNWTDGAINEQFFNLDTVAFDNSGANKSITLNTTVQPNSVTFNNSGVGNDYTISGTGGIAGLATTLSKSGDGKVTLAVNNTYSGGTTISGGTLQVGNGGTVGSLGSGTVVNNAAIIFNRSDTNTLAAAVNGTGSLQQSGTGTLVITSSNGYSGPTTIDSGTTIQLGNGGATGNLGSTSGVTNDGTLAYNRTNAHTLTAVISGAGSLVVNSGTLSLGANNTYSGTTTINAGGTLQIGNGGTSGSAGTGAITNNGTLAFNRSDTIAPASFSGTGTIQQNGSGTLLFSGPSTYTGATIVNNGTIAGQHANAFGSTPNIAVSGTATLSLRGDASTTFTRVSDSQPYSVLVSASGATVNVDQATIAGTAPKTMTIGPITATFTTPTYTLNFTGANNTSLSVGAMNGPVATQGFATTNFNFLNTSGTTTIASYTGNNTVGNETVNLLCNGDVNVTNGIFDPPSAWPMGVTKNGTGTLTLLGASTYSNGTVIANGVVAIGNDSALGVGLLNLNAADTVGVLQSVDGNTRTIANNVSNSSTNFTFGGTGDLVFTGTWDKGQFFKNLIVQTPVMTISGAIFQSNPNGANQAFSKEGTGTLIFAGANTYNGDTYVRQGTLTIAPTGQLGTTTYGLEVSNNNATGPGTNTVANLSTVNDTTVGNLSGFISAPTSGTNTATINTGGSGLNFTVNQTTALTAPAGIAGAGNFILGSLSTNTLTLTGPLTYTGSTAVNAARLALGTSLTQTSSVTLADGTAIELLAGGGSARVLRTPTLSIGAGAKVNIQDNKAILTAMPAGSWNGSAYTDVAGLVAAGRGTGNLWDGSTGIITSQTLAVGSNYNSIGVAKASDVRPSTATATTLWAGQNITGTDTLVMYTYGGDATLDGKINVDDYIKIDSGIAANLTGWSNGDFNYDGKVNIDDYTTVIDANIGNQNGVFPTSGGILAGDMAGVSAVPEPSSMVLLGTAGIGLLTRRSRRRRQNLHGKATM